MFRISGPYSLAGIVRSSRTFSTTIARNSGHNKWSKIKDKKGANDMQKSLLYSKASRDILIAARSGGSADPAQNVQLAAALKKAKDQGVPKENIEKVLARAAGTKEGSGNRVVYEALATDNVGLIIECWTDNGNRTLHNVREILTNRGARMTPVMFMFSRIGSVTVSISKSAPEDLGDKVLDLALKSQATDFEELEHLETEDSRTMEFQCRPEDLGQLEGGLRDGMKDEPLVNVLTAELGYHPLEAQNVEGEERQKVEELIRALEADSDTGRVYTSTSIRI